MIFSTKLQHEIDISIRGSSDKSLELGQVYIKQKYSQILTKL